MPIIPKVKDIPATGIEYRIRLFTAQGVLYGAPLLWQCGFVTTTVPQPPFPEGDITVPLDAFAMSLAQQFLGSAAIGFTVKVGRRWLFDNGATDFDNVGELPAPVVNR
jgi:hypothetical protein